MHKEHIAAFHLGSDDPILREMLVLDVVAVTGCTVVQQPVAVASGDDFDAAVFAKGVGQRHPNGEHLGFIGFGQNHTVVLMPGCGADVETGDPAVVVFGNAGQILLGWFDADVLDGVGVNFGADEVFDDVEELIVAQCGEGGGADGDR